MSEHTESEKPKKSEERPPIHKKQAKIYVFAVIGVLVFFLLLDTFQRAGDDNKKEEPEVQTEQMPRESNAPDFESRFTQEVERLQTSKDQPKPDETPKETMARLEAERNIKEQPYAQPGAGEQKVDLYQEFRDQERRRALSARRSKFKLKKKSGLQKSTTAMRPQPAAMPTSLDAQAIEAEKARVINEIQKLERMNQQRGGGSQNKAPLPAMPGYLKPSSGSAAPQKGSLIQLASATEGAPDALEQITVGMPASEGEAQKGQRLVSTTTVINAVLDQELMSDYTGAYRGLITHDVYDVTGNYIIIPKGSRMIGKCLRISNVNEPIQARMGLTVTWVVLPNGKRISLKKKADMLDQAGIHAVKDKVNYHFFAQFLGVAAYALISSETSRDGSGISQDTTYEGQVGEAMREQFAPLAAKYLDLVPTITLRAGTPIKIFLEDDIFAYEWSSLRQRLFKANRSSY